MIKIIQIVPLIVVVFVKSVPERCCRNMVEIRPVTVSSLV